MKSVKKLRHIVRMEALDPRRLLSAGALDKSFDADGMALIDFHGPIVQALDSAVQSDGKTVVVGFAETRINGVPQDTSIAVIRLNFDGSLDKTFGSDHTGIVRTAMPGTDPQAHKEATAVAIQPNGRILVTASDLLNDDGYILRYRSNGTLDTSFDHDGIVQVGFGFLSDRVTFRDIKLQSDGKIVAAGENFSFGSEMAVVRLNSDGSRDNSFDGDGVQGVEFDEGTAANAIAIDNNGTSSSNPNFGTIVLVGGTSSDTVDRFTVARLRSNGSLDTRFAGDGTTTFKFTGLNHAAAIAVTLQAGGKIVVAGTARPSLKADFSGSVFALARFTSNGRIDKSFGGNNTGTKLVGFGGVDEADSLVVGQNDRLIVGGHADNKMAIAALSKDGVLDNSFGTGGKVTLDFGGAGGPRAFGMAYGPGNRITASGGGRFNTARLFDIDGGKVGVGAINTTASEVGPAPVTFLVTRPERLPVPTRVFFNVGGSATAPTLLALRTHTNDYTMDGMSFPVSAIGFSSSPFVDIPANETFKFVTLRPVSDTRNEGNESATFTIKASSTYEAIPPTSVSITIKEKAATSETTINASADAFVRDGADAGKNFGTATELDIKKGGSGFNRRAYIKFDISSLSNINSVKLKVFGSLTNANQPSVAADIFSVADTSWTESGINFNNKPAPGTTALGRLTVSGTAAAFYEIDVTSFIQAQKAAGKSIVSFAIVGVADSDPFIKLNSREAGNGPALIAN